MTASEQAAKQIDVLLVSYKAIKDEIARRSALQWAILAGYALLLYNAFSAILKPGPPASKGMAWATATWAGSALALLFHCREQEEIMRLSHIISEGIDQRLKELGLVELLFERWGLGDEDQAKSPNYKLHRTKYWGIVFDIAIFFVGPSGLSLIVAFEILPDRLAFLVAGAAVVAAVSALGIGYLLRRG